jgi:tRNA modification GTPase
MSLSDTSSLDTIVALATPFGRSAIALIRVSGPETRRILGGLAPSLSGTLEPRRPTLAELVDAEREPIDRALVTLFPAPASFTGEDVAEITVHGSPAVIASVLAAASAAGARPARPGEFTERAFRNGKLDLVRAEAVRDLIEARTPRAARASLARLEGALSERFRCVREDLLAASAGLTAAIDFAEDAGETVPADVARRLSAAERELDGLAASHRAGRLLSAGARVAILGRPNAGKSTLFNALAGSARAIVTDVPGTTRDALEVELDLGGVPVTLVDTAGLRETEDLVESLGVARARAEAERADAILYVYDASAGLSASEEAELAAWTSRGSSSPTRSTAPSGRSRPTRSRSAGWRRTRATGFGPGSPPASRPESRSTRRRRCLDRSASATSPSARATRRPGRASRSRGESRPSTRAALCGEALAALADLVGETTADDVLARVFETFCIGK